MLWRKPWRISPLGHFRHNASEGKVAKLLERYPEIADPNVETIGITDTGYGEDHAWASAFTKVADINSSAPFPPIITAASPLREIHSALLLTLNERQKRDSGDQNYLDPRRKAGAGLPDRSFSFDAEELDRLLDPIVRQLDLLREKYRQRALKLDPVLKELERYRNDRFAALENAIATYNASLGKMRRKSLGWIRKNLKAERILNRRLAKIEVPLSELQVEISNLLDASRKLIDRRLAMAMQQAGSA
jgi:hypothetical protein